jgi:hypothetical protein
MNVLVAVLLQRRRSALVLPCQPSLVKQRFYHTSQSSFLHVCYRAFNRLANNLGGLGLILCRSGGLLLADSIDLVLYRRGGLFRKKKPVQTSNLYRLLLHKQLTFFGSVVRTIDSGPNGKSLANILFQGCLAFAFDFFRDACMRHSMPRPSAD